MAFSRDDIASSVTLLEKSEHADGMGLVVLTDQGPYLLCIWYRPPEPGETQTISTFENEWLKHCGSALGTIIKGDLHLHHLGWLCNSYRNSIEGEHMRNFCSEHGFRQLVAEATRGDYKLDLVMTDLEGVSCIFVPGIADHKGVLGSLRLRVPKNEAVERKVWMFSKANWDGLRATIQNLTCDFLSALAVDEAALALTQTILDAVSELVP